MTEYWRQDKLPSRIISTILIQVEGKVALQRIIEDRIRESFTDFLHRKKHEIFHLHIGKRCCCCQLSSLPKATMSMPKGQWQRLFEIVRGRCPFEGSCSCQYETVQNVNVASLDIPTLFILLLNICDLKDKERRKIYELQYRFLTRSFFDVDQCDDDMDEDDYEESFFNSVEHILLDILTETGHGEFKENIKLLKQRSSEYFRKSSPVLKVVLERVKKNADRTYQLADWIQEILSQSCERKAAENSEDCKEKHLKIENNLKHTILDKAAGGLHERYYTAESFPHFHYVYNLVKDCESRLLKTTEDEVMAFANELIIKISFVGNVSKEDLTLISKKRGSKKQQQGKLWVAVPLLCYEKSKTMLLNEEDACHKILIKNQHDYVDFETLPHSIAVVDGSREKLQEAITSCLEEPLIRTLEKWMKEVGNFPSKAASKRIFEMKSVLKHIFKHNSPKALFKVSHTTSESLVPINIKKFLHSRGGVNSFGLWRNGIFKVFVAGSTEKSELNDKLKALNPDFFEKYKLEIEARKFVQKKTLKQGDAILRKEDDKIYSATLGGLVIEKNSDDNIYGLTCNHIYPLKNQASYANVSDEESEIGKCVYTTRDKSCDFAVVKIEGNSRKECDISFRRDDGKRTKALVYTDNDLGNIGVVYKRGAETNLTKGNIVSWDYCAVVDDENKDNIFLIEGEGTAFSEQGDSGSVVFSRSRTVHQKSVDVLGMVYASNFEFREEESEETSRKDENDKCSVHSEDKGIASMESKVKPQKPSTVDHSNEKNHANIDYETSNAAKDPELFTCCFRIDTAFGLLKEEEKISVKFEDVSSSESSSHSIDSEDSDGKQGK